MGVGIMHKTFDAKELNEIRHTLSDKIWVRSQSPIGWSFLRKDFSFIFSILPSLKFREGYTIRAYRYVAAHKRSLKLQFWAVPITEWLPPPEECMFHESKSLSYPKPDCILDNLMDAIDGDGSFESYISSSLLLRTLVVVHRYTADNWGLNVIIDDALMKSADLFDRNLYFQKLRDINYKNSISKEEHFIFYRLTHFNTDDWKWKINRDNISWKPSVQFDGDNVKVTFYTYYGHLKKQIFKHTDTYAKGSYKFDSNCEIIAEGGEGYYI